VVEVEVRGGVGTVTIDHPPLNIITDRVRDGLLAALADLAARDVRAVVLTGGGERAFCAGADLREEQALTADSVQPFLDADEAVLSALEAYPGATVAAVRGYAYGGGLELALACDLRIAGRSARFAGVGVKVGLAVSTARLTRLCGAAVASDLLLTGRTVDGLEALDLGLVSAVVDDADLPAEAARWAETVAGRAPLAVRTNKAILAETVGMPYTEARALEREAWVRLSGTKDHKEALRAFFEKRPPRFQGA
jgi:enoyl-CoA hydratase